jgi:hypothetical protein
MSMALRVWVRSSASRPSGLGQGLPSSLLFDDTNDGNVRLLGMRLIWQRRLAASEFQYVSCRRNLRRAGRLPKSMGCPRYGVCRGAALRTVFNSRSNLPASGVHLARSGRTVLERSASLLGRLAHSCRLAFDRGPFGAHAYSHRGPNPVPPMRDALTSPLARRFKFIEIRRGSIMGIPDT